MREHAGERDAAFFEAADVLGIFFSCSVGEVEIIPDVAAVYDEDDGVADGVVVCPHAAEGVLAADVPDPEVHVWQGDCGDVLADGGDGGFIGDGGGAVEGFYGGEEGGFAGVVEAEEEDGVFWFKLAEPCW